MRLRREHVVRGDFVDGMLRYFGFIPAWEKVQRQDAMSFFNCFLEGLLSRGVYYAVPFFLWFRTRRAFSHMIFSHTVWEKFCFL